MKRVRMSPEGRREVILRAAVSLTQHAGCIDSWSRQDVANKCVPPTSIETVQHYFLMPDLRAAVLLLLDRDYYARAAQDLVGSTGLK